MRTRHRLDTSVWEINVHWTVDTAHDTVTPIFPGLSSELALSGTPSRPEFERDRCINTTLLTSNRHSK